MMISIETLLRKPFKKVKIDLENPTVKLIRQIIMLLLFTFSSVLFRAQSIAEVGLAFRQMFTAWDGVEKTFADLGMNGLQIIQLTIFIVAMALIYKLPQESKNEELPLAKENTAVNMGLFIYGILAIMLCWLGLLAMGDSSAFQYFQF